jgi:hypothetical protein
MQFRTRQKTARCTTADEMSTKIKYIQYVGFKIHNTMVVAASIQTAHEMHMKYTLNGPQQHCHNIYDEKSSLAFQLPFVLVTATAFPVAHLLAQRLKLSLQAKLTTEA